MQFQPLRGFDNTVGEILAGRIRHHVKYVFGIQIHIWQRFDSLFRQITARRNPNLLILMVATILGAPREGMIAVAAWTLICFLIHLARIGQAFVARQSGPLSSWLTEA